jgi:hypothetical protein
VKADDEADSLREDFCEPVGFSHPRLRGCSGEVRFRCPFSGVTSQVGSLAIFLRMACNSCSPYRWLLGGSENDFGKLDQFSYGR